MKNYRKEWEEKKPACPECAIAYYRNCELCGGTKFQPYTQWLESKLEKMEEEVFYSRLKVVALYLKHIKHEWEVQEGDVYTILRDDLEFFRVKYKNNKSIAIEPIYGVSGDHTVFTVDEFYEGFHDQRCHIPKLIIKTIKANLFSILRWDSIQTQNTRKAYNRPGMGKVEGGKIISNAYDIVNVRKSSPRGGKY